MNDETFRSRLMLLLQKSRKAVRMYSTVSKQADHQHLAAEQVGEWRDVNSDLNRALNSLLEATSGKALIVGAYTLRDKFHNEWRMTECDLHCRHKELLGYAENSDFIKVAQIAEKLIRLKARVQALQAVHHELQETLNRSNISQPTVALVEEVQKLTGTDSISNKSSAIERRVKRTLDSESSKSTEAQSAKIIPLRRLGNSSHY